MRRRMQRRWLRRCSGVVHARGVRHSSGGCGSTLKRALDESRTWRIFDEERERGSILSCKLRYAGGEHGGFSRKCAKGRQTGQVSTRSIHVAGDLISSSVSAYEVASSYSDMPPSLTFVFILVNRWGRHLIMTRFPYAAEDTRGDPVVKAETMRV